MYFQTFKCKIQLSFLLILFGISTLCFADALDTQLSTDQVTLGDSIYVTFILNNNASNLSPNLSALEKDFFVLNSEYGNAVSMVNGVTTSQTFWRLQLQPKKAGELIIPEVYFGSEKSAARKLEVSADPVNQTAPNSLAGTTKDSPVFVRGEISTTSPYVQSQVLYTLKLFFRAQLQDPRFEMPQIKDVTFIQLGDAQGYQTTVNGKVYNVAEKVFALFPQKAGALNISPIQFHALALDENSNTYFDPFNVAEPKPVAGSTKDFNLAVRDVPANFQGSTWLPAKNISLTEQWSDNTGHWGSGTPVTRTITIEAQGLRADQLPDLVFDKINGVSVYADRPKRTNNLRNDRVVGVYEQKVTYIPNSTQAFIIPALKINWWNTQTDSNAVAQLHEADVVVRPAPSAPNPPANIASAPMTHTPVTHDTNAVSKAFYTSVWFWIACLSLAAWAVTLWFMLRKKRDTDVKPAKQTPPTTEISDKSFEQACHSGQAVQAQQYLLAWAKTQWPRGSLNLASLRELIHDEEFNLALQELERALYSKKTLAWNGEALLAAFQRLKKSRKYLAAGSIKNSNLQIDPLPPLNPAH